MMDMKIGRAHRQTSCIVYMQLIILASLWFKNVFEVLMKIKDRVLSMSPHFCAYIVILTMVVRWVLNLQHLFDTGLSE